MLLFSDETLTDHTLYKAALKKALGQIKKDEVPFVFKDNHEFTAPAKKKAPLFVVEMLKVEPKLIKKLKDAGGAPLAEGTCYYAEDDSALVLEVTKGKVAATALAPLNVGAVVVRGAGDAPAPTPAGPIPADKNVGDAPIDLASSKVDQFPDVLRRQETKLVDADARIDAIKKEQAKLRLTLEALKANKPTATAPDDAKKAFAEATRAAADANGKLSEELSTQTKIKKLAESVIEPARAAKTDQERAAAVFADDKFGKALKELEGTAYAAMMATNDAVMVLGRTSDTWKLQLKDEEQARTLAVDPSLYTLTANDAFMKGGLDIKARFQLVSEFTPKTVAFMKNKRLSSQQFLDYLNVEQAAEPALWDSRSNAPAVSAREVGQLLDDGYWFGVYPDKDGKTIQMMFPAALKPDALAEIEKLRKG